MSRNQMGDTVVGAKKRRIIVLDEEYGKRLLSAEATDIFAGWQARAKKYDGPLCIVISQVKTSGGERGRARPGGRGRYRPASRKWINRQ